jgi:acetylglutamate kinase
MNVSEVTAKAKVLLEALPYIQDFRGTTFVVKYGGSFMDDPDPATRNFVAFDIAFLAARRSPERWKHPASHQILSTACG